MKNVKLKGLSRRQQIGLTKLGNVFFPGDAELPSFSKSECISDMDKILPYMPRRDLKDLKFLLFVLSYCPNFSISFFWMILSKSHRWPGQTGNLLRTMHLGLKGLVVSLYYSSPEVLNKLGYQVQVHLGD